MRREDWRRALETAATRREVGIICARREEWDRAVRECLPLCSGALQAEAAALAAVMRTGPCADCGVAVIWGPSTPHEPLKYCAPCGVKRIRPGDVVVDPPSTFEDA
jgi:hypothetical protein